MTLLLQMLVDLAVSAALWIAALVVVAGLAALAVHALSGRALTLRRMLLTATAGGAAVMALAHRVGAPDPMSFAVWRRDLLPVWAMVGAASTAAVAAVWHRRVSSTEAAEA